MFNIIIIREWKLKPQWDPAINLLECLIKQNWQCQVLLRMWNSKNSPTLFVRMQIMHPLWNKIWYFPIKLNIHLSYDSLVLLLKFDPSQLKTCIYRKSCSVDEWVINSGTSIQWNTVQQYRIMNYWFTTTWMNPKCI